MLLYNETDLREKRASALGVVGALYWNAHLPKKLDREFFLTPEGLIKQCGELSEKDYPVRWVPSVEGVFQLLKDNGVRVIRLLKESSAVARVKWSDGTLTQVVEESTRLLAKELLFTWLVKTNAFEYLRTEAA